MAAVKGVLYAPEPTQNIHRKYGNARCSGNAGLRLLGPSSPCAKPQPPITLATRLAYKFQYRYRGKEYYRSTGTENRREAEVIASAARARVVRQAADLEDPEPRRKSSPSDENSRRVPTLRQFRTTFDEWVATAKSEQHGTITFYQENHRKLLSYGPWADLPLDQIDEAHIEAFKTWALKHAGRPRNGKPTPVRKTTVNRYTDLFTLQYVAGHDNIKTTMRYVHPREAAVHKLFARLAELQQPEDTLRTKGRCKIRCSLKCPHRTNSLSC